MTERVLAEKFNFLKTNSFPFFDFRFDYWRRFQFSSNPQAIFKAKVLAIFNRKPCSFSDLSSLANLLISFFKTEELFLALEPSFGGTGLFFKKTKTQKLKIIKSINNDYNKNIPLLFSLSFSPASRLNFYATSKIALVKSNSRFVQKTLAPFSRPLENRLLWFYLAQKRFSSQRRTRLTPALPNHATPFLRFSHEIKTPLAIAKSLAWQELANGNNLFGQKISFSLEKVAQLAEDFSYFLKLEQEPILLTDSLRINLAETVTEIFCDLELLAAERNIEFNNFCAKNIFLTSANRGMEKALRNLIFNAFIYNQPNGKVEIHTTLYQGTVRLVILDTGQGINKKDLPLVFDLFYRSSLAKEIYPAGSGLGLSVAQKIIAQHNGQLAIESEENHGSVAVITLPASLG